MKPDEIGFGRHLEKIKILTESVFNGPGQSDSELRLMVGKRVATHSNESTNDASRLPHEIKSYVDKIALHAYKVTDADIDALLEAGYSEDVIFELTLSAALSAGMIRLKSGMSALMGGQDAA